MPSPVTLAEALSDSRADVKVLVVVPSPLNNPARLSMDSEVREMFDAVDSVRANVDIFRLHPPTLPELRAAVAYGGFRVVHIATHGGHGVLEFEKEDGTAVAVSHQEFADIFGDGEGCLLVLNGCDTEGLGDHLIRNSPGLTALSVAGDISRGEAHVVVRSIYRSLFTGATPEQAAVNSTVEVKRVSNPPEVGSFVRARGAGAAKSIFRSVSIGGHRPRFYKCEPTVRPPRRLPVLFDRESETLEIYSNLFRSGVEKAVIGVRGITGTGKTALVRSFAGRYGWRFPDGIYYFSVDQNSVVQAVVQAFEWALDTIPPPLLISEVVNRLGKKRCLLVFDDLDDGSPAVLRELAIMLNAWDTGLGGRAIIIAQTYRPEFDAIIGPSWTAVGRLPVDAASDLVMNCLGGAERARRTLGDSEVSDVADLCFGHPRTIESTSALLRLGHSWTDLRDDLEQLNEHGPIRTNRRVLEEIVARIERNHPIIRDLLDALTVFSGTCRESTWRRVTTSALGGETLDRVMSQGLAELNFARLIDRHDVDNVSMCYLHPLVLGYLRSRYSGLSGRKQRGYVHAHLMEQARLIESDPDYAAAESKNIRYSLQLAAELEMWPEIIQFCSDVVGERDCTLIKRGPWVLARDLLDAGLAAARQQVDEVALLRLLISRGATAYRLTAFDEAGDAFDEAITIADRHDNQSALLRVTRAKGQLAYRVGDLVQAGAIFRQALVLSSDLDELAVAEVEHHLGKVLYRQGRFAEARLVLRRVRNSREGKGSQRELAKVVHELGRVEQATGHSDLARALYTEALQLERAAGDPVAEQATLFQLGRLSIEEGDITDGRMYLEQSAQISEKLSDYVWLAHAAFGQALLAFAIGDLMETGIHVEQALKAARSLRIGLSKEIEDWATTAGLKVSDG